MAKQRGILMFVGKMGRMVYYYHKHFGYLIRSVTSVNAARIRNDPAFRRVRDNNTEFAHGAWVVRLIRAAFLPLFEEISDTRMTSRLMSRVLAAIKSNTNQPPGQRRFEDADLAALKGFEFNLLASLDTLRMPQHRVAMDYTSRSCTLVLSEMNLRMLRKPKGATHVQFVMGIASIDIATGQYALNRVSSPAILLRELTAVPMVFTGMLPAGTSSHVFVTLGAAFFQAVGDALYVLKSAAHDALTLVYAAATPIHRNLNVKRSHRYSFRRRFNNRLVPLRNHLRGTINLFGYEQHQPLSTVGSHPIVLPGLHPSTLYSYPRQPPKDNLSRHGRTRVDSPHTVP